MVETRPQIDRRLTALAGVLGPLALTVYFATPWLVGWPMGNVTDTQLASFASQHRTIFFLGAWFQGVGTLLSVLFFLGLVHQARAGTTLAGLAALMSSAVLLTLSLTEGAFLMTVPLAVASGHTATAQATFDLSTITFVRVFPSVPAPAVFLSLGTVLLSSSILPRTYGYLAIGLGVAFAVVGFGALLTDAILIPVIGLLLAEELWIVSAAVALWRSTSANHDPVAGATVELIPSPEG